SSPGSRSWRACHKGVGIVKREFWGFLQDFALCFKRIYRSPLALEYVMGRIIIILAGIILVAVFIIVVFNTPGGPNLILNPSFETPPGDFVDDPNEHFDRNSNSKALCGGSSTLENWEILRGGVPTPQDCNTAKDAVAWVESPNSFGIGRPRESDL